MANTKEHAYITQIKKDFNISSIEGYENNEETNEYIDNMDDKIRQAMSIAAEHLGSSFHFTKSNGYVDYQKNKNK